MLRTGEGGQWRRWRWAQRARAATAAAAAVQVARSGRVALTRDSGVNTLLLEEIEDDSEI